MDALIVEESHKCLFHLHIIQKKEDEFDKAGLHSESRSTNVGGRVTIHLSEESNQSNSKPTSA